jgi:hypothetical protein
MDTLLFIAITLSTIWEVGLGIVVYMVHHKMETEHKIDHSVRRVMHTEKIVTLLAIIFIVCGYILEAYYYSVN